MLFAPICIPPALDPEAECIFSIAGGMQMGVNKMDIFPWGYLYLLYILTYFLYMFLFFYVRLIVNKRGALEAPINYPLNFT